MQNEVKSLHPEKIFHVKVLYYLCKMYVFYGCLLFAFFVYILCVNCFVRRYNTQNDNRLTEDVFVLLGTSVYGYN